MHNQNGFTLLELLVAAIIVGALVVFATQTFRKVSSQTRVEDAKARAKVVAMSTRRFLFDYPAAKANVAKNEDDEKYFIGIVNPANEEQCYHNQLSAQILVNCGYLEYRQYASEFRDPDAADAYRTNFEMWFEVNDGSSTGRVCFQGSSARILDARIYCTDGETVTSQDPS